MSQNLQEAFEQGNYVLVRRLDRKGQFRERLKTDPYIVLAGIGGLVAVVIATLITLC